MTIETAVFAVQRGDQHFSCKGSQLRSRLADGDILLVNRDGIDYQFVLEEQGKLKIIQHVNFEFNEAGAVVIIQNAEATGGDTPYELVTEYDMELGDAVFDKTLTGRTPISAAVASGTPYISFGKTSPVQTGDPQDLYSLNIEQVKYEERYANVDEDGNPIVINNRFGLRSLYFQDKKIIMSVYNLKGNLPSPGDAQAYQFMYFGLDEENLTSLSDKAVYSHLHDITEAACAGFVSDKDGTIYSAWYSDGLYGHRDVPVDSFGYPDFTDTSIITTKIQTGTSSEGPNGTDYYKGLSYHEESNSIMWSTQKNAIRYDLNTNTNYVLNTGLESDGGKSIVHCFTSTYAIRTVIEESGAIRNISCGRMSSPDDWQQQTDQILYINDPNNTYLFKIEGGKTIEMLDYNYTEDPFDSNAPWEEFRSEQLPPGDVGGAGTITLDPFTLMWFQDGMLKSWGVIPDSAAEVTVTQTITDAKGDSVSSSTTKDAS